jgi:hypothetical protein
MNDFRILVANEPRSYREAMAIAIEALLPDAEVLVFDPVWLEAQVTDLDVDLVLCSRSPGSSRGGRPLWVELYPNGDTLVRFHRDGKSFMLLDVELEDLLALIDQTERRKSSAKGGR